MTISSARGWSCASNAPAPAVLAAACAQNFLLTPPSRPSSSSSCLNVANFTRQDFREALQCRDVFSRGPRPLHDESTWRFLRRTYREVVDAEDRSIVPSLLEDGEPEDGEPSTYVDGVVAPFYVGYSPGMGRGVFAGKDIEEGAPVWRSTCTAIFEEADDFREYLAAIPANLACDVMEWSYTYYDDEHMVVGLDLDAMSFCNDGSVASRQNLRAARGPERVDVAAKDELLVAARRIEAGQELLCDYSAFFNYEGWSKLGL